MKTRLFSCLGLVLMAVLALGRADASAAETGWPRTYTSAGSNVVINQPQIRDWPNYTLLHGLAAVQVTPAGGTRTVYGVVGFEATTSADFASGLVTLTNTHITSTNFPNEPESTAKPLEAAVRGISFSEDSVPLASVLASLDAATALPKSAPVAVAPPTIFYTEKKALLLSFDREPVMVPIADTGLTFAANTNWALIKDGTARSYYLLATDHWLSATSFSGPWSPATAPASFAKLPDTKTWEDARKQLDAKPLPATDVPHVFYSDKPAELIAVDGSPKRVSIPDTGLDYVSNTGSNLFVEVATKRWYVLLSGRWYRAANVAGPWTYASTSLPPGFAKIPVNSARGGVLVSVPGTPEAEFVGASMAVPQIVGVNPATTQVSITYNGTPVFEPIAGTTVAYATNTPNDVIRVAEGSYYACYSGVWFTSGAALGPWTVAGFVPKAIYSIPPSSPVYGVTYVYVYNSLGQPVYAPPAGEPATTVYVGYTAGYMGAYWLHGAWVYGTGYYYSPYFYGGIYYPYPPTWLGGAIYTGGSYYNSSTGYYGNQIGIYGPYGGATARAAYNPTTGTYARGAAVYGPYGGAAAGSFYNPKYGVAGTTYQQRSIYGSYGRSIVQTKNGTTYTAHASNANGKAGVISGPNGTAGAIKNNNGDIYAGRNGDVYKKTGEGWQKSNGNGGWSDVKPANPSQLPTLERDRAARTSGSNGFSGFRGGGGIGRRR